MKQRTVIYADAGKVLTNGSVYGKIIYLAVGESAYDYYEITDAEYEERMRKEEEERNV